MAPRVYSGTDEGERNVIRRSFESIVATWLAGLLMLLPLALTLAVLVWVLK